MLLIIIQYNHLCIMSVVIRSLCARSEAIEEPTDSKHWQQLTFGGKYPRVVVGPVTSDASLWTRELSTIQNLHYQLIIWKSLLPPSEFISKVGIGCEKLGNLGLGLGLGLETKVTTAASVRSSLDTVFGLEHVDTAWCLLRSYMCTSTYSLLSS